MDEFPNVVTAEAKDPAALQCANIEKPSFVFGIGPASSGLTVLRHMLKGAGATTCVSARRVPPLAVSHP